jgi:hypothetical protein
MGWWSATIMGGDTPMDDIANMEDLCGVLTYDEETNESIVYTPEQIRFNLTANIPKLIAYCEEQGDDYTNIAYQVLGYIILTNGVPLIDTLKARILKACELDEWYESRDPERVHYINQFMNQIKAYDGTPTEIAEEGLFDVFENHIVEGKVGLVNKNV